MEAKENVKESGVPKTAEGETIPHQVRLSIRQGTRQPNTEHQNFDSPESERYFGKSNAATAQHWASQATDNNDPEEVPAATRPPTSHSRQVTPEGTTNETDEAQILLPPSPSSRRHPARSSAPSPEIDAELQGPSDAAKRERSFVARQCNIFVVRRFTFARFLTRLLKRRMWAKTRKWHLRAEKWPNRQPRDAESLELRHRVWLQATLTRLRFEALAIRQACLAQKPHGHDGDELQQFFVWLQIVSTCGGDVRLCQSQFEDEDMHFDDEDEEGDGTIEDNDRQTVRSEGTLGSATEEAVYTEEDIESFIP